jgi:hypothetical protein
MRKAYGEKRCRAEKKLNDLREISREEGAYAGDCKRILLVSDYPGYAMRLREE